MVRVVLDTNILISATYWMGDSHKIIQLIEGRKIIGITTPEVLKEYERIAYSNEILQRVEENQVYQRQVILGIIKNMTVIKPINRLNIVKHDPDNKFLEAAVEGNARFIISQDHHLLDLKEYNGIQILTPKDFLNIYFKDGEKI